MSLLRLSWILFTPILCLLFAYTFLSKPPLINEVSQPIFGDKNIEAQNFLPDYTINYGNANAPLTIIEYFSFQCPHCIQLFKQDFERIKKDFIDTGKIFFQFQPVPYDLTTVQAIICMQKLEELEKNLFLEAIFEEAIPGDADLMSTLMMTAMNVFKKPIPNLNDQNYLSHHPFLEKIYSFFKHRNISAVPTVEVNGQLYAKEIPDYQFIKSFVKE